MSNYLEPYSTIYATLETRVTNTCRLAHLIMWSAHREMHRASPSYTTSQSCKTAWIVKANRLAVSVGKKCMLCRRIRARLGKQIMGDRKVEHLLQAPPPSPS